MENNTNNKLLQGFLGLNNDNITSQIKEGQLTFAKNAMVENFDGNQVTYQNEMSNVNCLDLTLTKPGYTVIGLKNIIEQNKTILFLTDNKGNSEIGYKLNNKCNEYHTIINSPCLNFSINHPIHKVIPKTTNCNTQLFWTDGFNPRRWIDLDDLPFVEVPNPDNENKPIKTSVVDCNKMLVQPNFTVPIINVVAETVGGTLVEGSYEFAIQYSNSLGEGYTSFYGFTMGADIHSNAIGPNTDSRTTKAISLHISNLDTTGLYDYFNLVAIETINGITTAKLVGTFAINGKSIYNTIYTGNDSTAINISIDEIFQRFPYYDIAQDVATSDSSLLWVDLSSQQKINYQDVWSNVILNWIEYQIPYNTFEGYNTATNTANYRGYLRDEVYALYGCFILKNGKITEYFPIPGRMSNPSDREVITNADALQITNNPCEDKVPKERWQVYNTATVTGFTDEYINRTDSCYKGSYRYGQFAYWQSTKTYPNNKDIYGNLAGQYIRHHKFPDCLVSPIHDTTNIYPLGIQVDAQSLYSALNILTQQQRDEIAGFKIVRANRANNQSIVAKGLLYNVGEYTRDEQTYFYPNYPFNDLRQDPFISKQKVTPHTGSNSTTLLDGFNNSDSRSRFTLLSPDTTFDQPTGVDSGYLKAETVEYGKAKSHFVLVDQNARYKFLTTDAVRLAFAAGMSAIAKFEISAGFPSGVKASPGLELANALPVFSTTLELLKNITPYTNYGWSFNSVGDYNLSYGIPNNGNKNRSIDNGSYILSGFQTVDDKYTFNNYLRESSVYIKTNTGFPFPHEYGGNVPIDNSRYTISQIGCSVPPGNYNYRDISAIYASIKRILPDQYNLINSNEVIDTGFYSLLLDNNNRFKSFPTIFGGDTFINKFGVKRKHSFFLSTTALLPDGTDIALDELGNVGYPVYYYSTGPRDITIDFADADSDIDAITNTSFWNILFNIVSGGIRPTVTGLKILNRIMQAYIQTLGVPNVNLECDSTGVLNEIGKAYLYAYGISYFFVESNINVDMRYATNDAAGNYYPRVGTDIPDTWLQEKTVSIINDNSYNYNISYSKQIKEINFVALRADFDPNKLCFVDFPNRVIYSQKSNLEETKNNWLIYRPISYHDFPKNYGSITAMDGLEDRRVLVRFENKSLLYNVYQTTDSSTGTVYLGNPLMFSQPPLDFAETDSGYNGSQNKFILKTEIGHITTDANRGQIFLYRGNQIDELSLKGMEKFFTLSLGFAIRERFPNAKIDNHFKKIGLTGVYDVRYNRILITKKDYKCINNSVLYDSDIDEYYIVNNNIKTHISLDDTNYFCNQSFTISFSFTVNGWTSFHSYIPNYYIQHPNYFESGINNSGTSIWQHGNTASFLNFYNKQEEYIIEYPVSFIPSEEIVGTIIDYTTILKYDSVEVFYEVDDKYFTNAIIYNTSECTGILNLIPRPINNLKGYLQYPKFNVDSKDIIVTKKDSNYSFNTFWDIVANKQSAFYARPCSIPSLDKVFNVNLDYSTRSYRKARIRSKECRIRLIYNGTSDYKLISKFVVVQTQKSII